MTYTYNMHELESSILQSLNPEQLTATTYPGHESLLVLAGAGSGKTKVLTSRVAWLLSTCQSVPQSILAVTFTNKAAKEMRSRIEQLLPYSVRDMWLGTFHSLCHRLLRKFHAAVGLKSNFQIIDAQDQLSIIKRILKNDNVLDSVIAPKELVRYINNNKECGYRSDNPLIQSRNQYDNQYDKYNLFIHYYAIYEQTCRQENWVDFTELLLLCVETLRKNSPLRQELNTRFHHILVDEFQDTNNLQYEWLKLMKGQHSTIFAVGDDDQSIYSFRGANVDNMQNLIKQFNLAKPITLEQNYRSTQVILDAANQLISRNQNRIGKNLRSTQTKGELIRYMCTYSELEESQFVAETIKSLHHTGESYYSIAVLYRNNALSRAIEQSLFNANIPYKIYGGLRFYEREEIKHALAYLRLLINPEDSHSFLRVLNFPHRGIGAKTIESLQETANLLQLSLWEILLKKKLCNKNLANFYHLIYRLQDKIEHLSLPDLINEVINTTGLIKYYEQKKGDFQNKIDNLHELVNAASSFANNTLSIYPQDRVIEFLSHASLEVGERNSQNLNNTMTDYIQLMTIHSAKGLEFDTVFLIAMEENIFPNWLSLEENNLEEERRLMYVAITRAKKNLYLSSTLERYHQGRKKSAFPSQFIAELPKHLIHYLSDKNIISSENTDLPSQKNNAPPTPSKKSVIPYALGMIVQHTKFGTGVIINKQQQTHSYLLTINFGQHGIKTIDSAYATFESD